MGISFVQLFVILLAIVGVIVVVRLVRSAQGGGRRDTLDQRGRGAVSNDARLVKCPVCGDFIDPSATSCGRADCPR